MGTARIEIGWVLDARLEEVDREAAEGACLDALEALRSAHPGFEWRAPIVTRELPRARGLEPVELLDAGAAELELHHWDFALVVTGAELRGHYGPSPSGVPSRAIGVGVLSTFHVDPRARESALDASRGATMRRRLLALAMHVIGHWLGLDHGTDEADYMTPPERIEDLDRRRAFGEGARPVLERELAQVADARVEEEEGGRYGRAQLYLRSVWRNRANIRRTLAQSRAWEFPIRLGRLTTAAASALVVFLLSAESWDVGTRQPAGALALLSTLCVGVTSAYVLHRQRLLPAAHGRRRPTEQGAVAHASLVLVVLTGMVITYALLFVAALLLGNLLVSEALIGRWTASGEVPPGWEPYGRMAAFTAALGIVIGALGASFEGQHFVRHIAYVDEEL